jgi:hypothetical protein
MAYFHKEVRRREDYSGMAKDFHSVQPLTDEQKCEVCGQIMWDEDPSRGICLRCQELLGTGDCGAWDAWRSNTGCGDHH